MLIDLIDVIEYAKLQNFCLKNKFSEKINQLVAYNKTKCRTL